jgi:1-acyl-sn-glycerol-3-phosphate acyltransferase
MAAGPPEPAELDVVRARSPVLCRFFERMMRRQMQRNFHKLRLVRPGVPELPDGAPLIVYTNHPSWWDPAFFAVLGFRLFGEREHYGPIEAKMLEQYRFMRRIGIFGIEPGTREGAAAFLKVGAGILADARRMLWVTAQGRFSDPRERPLGLRPGVARLLRRVPGAVALPLAVEYPFWTEKLPEALARFGPPQRDPERLELALTETVERLAEDAMARDPARFETLLEGRAGIGGFYDLWRRAAATLRGDRFRREHLPEEGPEEGPEEKVEDGPGRRSNRLGER